MKLSEKKKNLVFSLLHTIIYQDLQKLLRMILLAAE
jgi:hypothetical protein